MEKLIRKIKTAAASLMALLPALSTLSYAASTYDPVEMMALVNASPAAVEVHDRNSWLELFSYYATIEDPVGTRPHTATGFNESTQTRNDIALQKFYDTFIKPNDIIFHVERDVIAGSYVLRSVNIETRLGHGVIVTVPTHILYEVVVQENELKLNHLAAHWELQPMVQQVLGKGFNGLMVMFELGFRMIGVQGIQGVVGYMQGFKGILASGKSTVNSFVDAVNNNDSEALSLLFKASGGSVEFPMSERSFDVSTFAQYMQNVSIEVSQLQSAGWNTTFEFTLVDNGETHRGVGIFVFDAATKKLAHAEFYWDD